MSLIASNCHTQCSKEEFYGREIIVADRGFVEQKAENLIDLAKTCDIAFLGLSDIIIYF